MTYIDAVRKNDTIYIVDRVDGERVFNEVPSKYVAYYTHGQGTYTSIFGDACKKIEETNREAFRKKLNNVLYPKPKTPNGRPPIPAKVFETDINPVFRALEENYKNATLPKLNVAFFDIEADFDPERGFAPIDDPFNKITAISIHLSHIDKLFTFALCPPTMAINDAKEIENDFENTVVFDNEIDMLESFLDIIEDADILSGFNSEGYDIPYMVNRIKRLMGEEATYRLCLYSPENGWVFKPRPKEVKKFKKKFNSYDLVGRVHLDYLLLYKKHNTQQLHSYRLDYIGEIEVGENKVPYEGTLDELYKKDFKRFVEYNRQDVALLVKIDAKKKFIDLANQVAHTNCVLFKTTLGSVSLVEQAIINEMHEMGFVVPNRKATNETDEIDEDDDEEHNPVVGAYVADPKVGLHEQIGCVDVNSLYPHAIMALNMSPETIFGQIRLDETNNLIDERIASGTERAEAWDGIFEALEVKHMLDKDDVKMIIDFEDGTSKDFTGKQLYEYVFNPKNHLCITANGTLFKTNKDGIIPVLLAKWYSERKKEQKLQAYFEDLALGIEIDNELVEMLK